jgi:hypothetical protein
MLGLGDASVSYDEAYEKLVAGIRRRLNLD